MIKYFVIRDFRGTCSLFICRNAEEIVAYVSEYLRGTWETKVGNPCCKSTVNKNL